MSDYTEDEFIAALYKAFVVKKFKSIQLDGWSSRFQRTAAEWAFQRDWLTRRWHEEHQYSCWFYEPTELGLRELAERGLPATIRAKSADK